MHNGIASSSAKRAVPTTGMCFVGRQRLNAAAGRGKHCALGSPAINSAVMFSFIKCSARGICIRKNTSGALGIQLGGRSGRLGRILIGPGGKHCEEGSGPTIRLVQGIVTTGRRDSLGRGSCCHCSGCRHVAFTFGGVARRFLSDKFLDGCPLFMGRIRFYPRARGLVVPLACGRASSRRVFQGRPRTRQGFIEKAHSRNLGRLFAANSVIGVILRHFFTSIGVCSGSVGLLRHCFADPLSSASTVSFCRCCVVSALVMSTSHYVRLDFIPRGPRSFKFSKGL